MKKFGKILAALASLAAAGAVVQRYCSAKDRHETKNAYGRLVEVQGKNMCVRLGGSGRETVVLLPGAGEASPGVMFKPLAEELGRQYRTVTVEYFGYGLSDSSPSARTVENVAEELHELLQKLGLDRYILLAHSYSGITALYYMNRYPGEVAAYVGIDPTAAEVGDYCNVGAASLRFQLAARAMNRLGVLRLLSKVKPSVVTGPVRGRWYSKEDVELYRRLCLNGIGTGDVLEETARVRETLEQMRDVPIPCHIPALQFLATESAELLTEYGGSETAWYDMHRKLSGNPRSAVVILEGGHCLQCVYPREIANRFHLWIEALKQAEEQEAEEPSAAEEEAGGI